MNDKKKVTYILETLVNKCMLRFSVFFNLHIRSLKNVQLSKGVPLSLGDTNNEMGCSSYMGYKIIISI